MCGPQKQQKIQAMGWGCGTRDAADKPAACFVFLRRVSRLAPNPGSRAAPRPAAGQGETHEREKKAGEETRRRGGGEGGVCVWWWWWWGGQARVGEAGGAAELGEAQLQAPLLVQRPREGVLRAAGPGALRMFET